MLPLNPLQTIPAALAATVERRADEQALGFIREGAVYWRSWREVADESARLAAAVRAAGVEPGDRVAHVSENRYEWIITDLALHLAQAVHVPIHCTLSGQQIAEQIADCRARLIFASGEQLLSRFISMLERDVPVWLHDQHSRAALEDGANQSANTVGTAAAPEDLASILYTSGTTGQARGVMLSQRNLASNATALADAFGGAAEQTRLCFLPLSHIYARTCDLYTWVCRGSRLVLAESRDTLARDCQLARPTALSAVPYVYQRIADRVRTGSLEEDAAKLRAYFGGRMETLTCGGAPLAPDVETWFAERGLPILAGYGLTEASPVISASTPGGHRFGSVGRPLPGVDVRIADDGEILARGPNVMQAYANDGAATAEVIRDGWLHTGDLGELDADGFLYIRGRKKEIIVLSTGKNVFPTRVESLLTSSPLIEQAAVFGDGLPVLVALIVPSEAGLKEAGSKASRQEKFAEEIARCLNSAGHHEQVRSFALLDRPLSIERGELTPKLSLCREAIAQNFAAELQRLSPQTTLWALRQKTGRQGDRETSRVS